MPGQPGHRDIEIAAAERSQQQEECRVGAETYAHIGHAQRLHLDPRYQYEKHPDQQGKVRECQGEILELAQIHAGWSVLTVARGPRGAASIRERHRRRLDPALTSCAGILPVKVRKALAAHLAAWSRRGRGWH